MDSDEIVSAYKEIIDIQNKINLLNDITKLMTNPPPTTNLLFESISELSTNIEDFVKKYGPIIKELQKKKK